MSDSKSDTNRVTLGEVLRRSTDHLAARGAERPRLDAERLLGRALGMERVELYMHLDRPLTPPELDARARSSRTTGGGRAAPVRPR